jgi:hypothetical protein
MTGRLRGRPGPAAHSCHTNEAPLTIQTGRDVHLGEMRVARRVHRDTRFGGCARLFLRVAAEGKPKNLLDMPRAMMAFYVS